MFGLFLENGPLRVTKGSGEDDFKISAAEQAWTDDYNVIFVDQPVNTGFSYANKSLTSMKEGSQEFVRFIELFYEKYPELKSNDFHLTGESYAGKYLPLFTHDILERNKKAEGFKIPLKTTQIIDPYPSPVTQRTTMHLVGKGLNILDQNQLNQISVLEQHCQESVNVDIVDARDKCNTIMDYIGAVSGGVMPYDSMIFEKEWDVKEAPIIEMFGNSTRKDEIF